MKIENPNKDQIDALIRVISYAKKSDKEFELYLNLSLPTIKYRIEHNLRSQFPTLTDKEIRERINIHYRYFEDYKNTHKVLSEEIPILLNEIKTFNEKTANIPNQTVYKPKWLTVDFLKSLN